MITKLSQQQSRFHNSRFHSSRFHSSRFHNYSLDKQAVPISVVLPLVKMMEDKGFPPEISLAGAGIDLSADTVSYQQRITQLSNMLDLLGMDGAWLEFPRDVSISTMDCWVMQ